MGKAWFSWYDYSVCEKGFGITREANGVREAFLSQFSFSGEKFSMVGQLVLVDYLKLMQTVSNKKDVLMAAANGYSSTEVFDGKPQQPRRS